MKLGFFGSSEFSVFVLDELEKLGIKPDLVITTPDKPKGRKLALTPTHAKTWAQSRSIEVLESVKEFRDTSYDLFLVTSYGKIIKPEIFNLPKHKTLNIHPSLLPKYRGASPVVSQILNDEQEIGVTIMQIDEEMDHGGIVTQKETSPLAPLLEAGEGKDKIEELLAREGARLFAEKLPDWLEGKIEAKPQDESQASYCTKIKKEDGLINLEDDSRKNYLKFLAYQGWPTTFFFDNNKRIIITSAIFENNKFEILKVKPEGKKEMPYEDYLRGKK